MTTITRNAMKKKISAIKEAKSNGEYVDAEERTLKVEAELVYKLDVIKEDLKIVEYQKEKIEDKIKSIFDRRNEGLKSIKNSIQEVYLSEYEIRIMDSKKVAKLMTHDEYVSVSEVSKKSVEDILTGKQIKKASDPGPRSSLRVRKVK